MDKIKVDKNINDHGIHISEFSVGDIVICGCKKCRDAKSLPKVISKIDTGGDKWSPILFFDRNKNHDYFFQYRKPTEGELGGIAKHYRLKLSKLGVIL